MSEPKIIPAIKGTRPRYSHLEAEELMEIILASGHPRAEHLVGKLVTGAEQPGVYIRTLERVRASVTPNAEGPSGPGELQRLVLERYPQADRFELTGTIAPGQQQGLTFSIGTHQWYFVAPDRYISTIECPYRRDAQEAFEGYMQAKNRPAVTP